MIGAVSATSDTTSDDIVKQNINSENNNHNNNNHGVVAKANTKKSDTKTNNNVNEIKKEETKNKLSTNKNKKDLLTDTNTPGNFTQLQTKINAANTGDTITLTTDYQCEDGFTDGITIDGKKITINGDGHTIDAQKKGRIFQVRNNAELIINNLKLINGKATKGGAIYTDSLNSNCNLTIINTTFNNNTATSNWGGAIHTYTKSDHSSGSFNLTIINTTFNQNTAPHAGGAIYTYTMNDGRSSICSCNLTIINTTFNNNTANSAGGAIYTVTNNMNGDSSSICSFNLTIINTTFNKNTATNRGGAISTYTAHGDSSIISTDVAVDNALFYNNNADNFDGISCLYEDGAGGTCTVKNSAFIDDTCNINLDDSSKTYTDGSFTALNAIINNVNPNDPIIELTNNYTYNTTIGSTDQQFIKGIPINKTITIQGNGYTINGSQEARIFTVTNGAHLTLINCTLTQGQGQNETIPDVGTCNVGGAIYINTATVTIINSTLTHNNADYGGAIENDQGNLTINNSQFTHNNANNDYGGAIENDQGNLTISNSQFTNNTATWSGGAIYNYQGNLNINNSNLTNNNADYGGAIENDQGNLNINNSNLTNNNADYGGAIYNNYNLTISNSQFTYNNADYGGAIYAGSSSKSNVTGSLFMDNTAKYYGSAIRGYGFDILIVNHNIFLNNTGANNVIVLTSGSNVNFDFNWFGNTADNYNATPNVGTTISNWLFLNATADPNPVQVLNSSNITFELSLYNSSLEGGKVYPYDNSQLKKVNLTITPNPNIEKTTALLGEKILYTASKLGSDSVTASISDISHTINLEITKIPTQITVNTKPITLNVTDNQQINAKLNPSEAGMLKYASNDTSVASVDKYGMITAISKGTALITVYFNGEGYYAAAENKTVLVTVNLKEINTQITGLTIPTELFEGKTSNIIGTLTANNTGFTNQKIIISITNNKGYKETFTGKTDANGKFNIKVKPGVSGLVTITTAYNGHKTNKYNYKQASKSTNVNVQKVVYNIKLDTLQASYDYNTKVNITGQITSNYKPLDVKNVNITINGVRKTVALNNKGEFKYASPYTTAGLYKVLVNCSGTTQNTQYFIKYPTKFIISKIPDTTTNKAVIIIIKESNGFTGTVNVKIGKQDYKVQLTNGEGSKNIKITTAGTYIASVNFPGNNKYGKASTNSNKFTVKYPTKFTISKIPNIKQGSKIQLTITEKNKYSGLVKVTIGSETYTVKLNKGIGKKTVTPKLAPGKYIAKIKFGGNGKYSPANAVSNKFQVTQKQVVKLDTEIIAVKKTFYVEDANKKYNISLKDANGKIVKNAQVTLKVKGKTYKTKTNNKGVATFDLTNLDQKGQYNSLIKYAGDKNYKASNKKVKITVKIRFTTVSKGSKDKKTVKKIQKALKKNGYYLHAGKYYLKIDGIYYNWTEKEVRRYQKNNKLPVTGKVDYYTAIKLGII